MSSESAPKVDASSAAKKTTTKKVETPEWVVYYNLLSGSLWALILFNIVVVPLVFGDDILFDMTSSALIGVQTLAIIEVYNSAVGNVKSPVFTTAMQVASRYLIVWGIFYALPEAPSNYHWCYKSLNFAWSITEVIRYYYYAQNTLTNGNPPKILTLLRYNAFIVLYPIGVASEMLTCYLAADEAALMVGRWYAVLLRGILFVYPPGLFVLYTHMLKQRKKVMKSLKENASKEKKN
ncbi:hypothetical protein B5S31_g836 [[Candida] boidinii]|uniref:Unnamed protein product n=1 Tax=Candida boidinii TaxID=5477 RepID=A0ACB5TUB5_CANBO|nr:hypothetical protein B5S29_g879 [[Candida] boidinii]OWB71151.1 hypothetical protein B5S31_g836 [[Candida] boidinii]OWB77024.1 hypothetical protein B5S32_g1183 [[Candida] boidinii]GME89417.1 unnamed protein product [[Candida] boidinii]GME95552.1 unnamed protein product [[Candida] boidinii]